MARPSSRTAAMARDRGVWCDAVHGRGSGVWVSIECRGKAIHRRHAPGCRQPIGRDDCRQRPPNLLAMSEVGVSLTRGKGVSDNCPRTAVSSAVRLRPQHVPSPNWGRIMTHAKSLRAARRLVGVPGLAPLAAGPLRGGRHRQHAGPGAKGSRPLSSWRPPDSSSTGCSAGGRGASLVGWRSWLGTTAALAVYLVGMAALFLVATVVYLGDRALLPRRRIQPRSIRREAGDSSDSGEPLLWGPQHHHSGPRCGADHQGYCKASFTSIFACFSGSGPSRRGWVERKLAGRWGSRDSECEGMCGL